MRERLAVRRDQRLQCQAVFARYGEKRGWQGRHETTLLLTSITDTAGQLLCDHLWFNRTRSFAVLALRPGDVVQFSARVSAYVRGYFGRRLIDAKLPEIDYKLSYPTKVIKITPTPVEAG